MAVIGKLFSGPQGVNGRMAGGPALFAMSATSHLARQAKMAAITTVATI